MFPTNKPLETYSRIDPDNGTVLLMHLGDLPLERSAFDEIIVEFGPICQAASLGPGKWANGLRYSLEKTPATT